MDITPDEARRELERARPIDHQRERRVYGWTSVAIGLAVTAYFALFYFVENTRWEGRLLWGYLALLAVVVIWQQRATRAVPRHARRIDLIGLGGTLIAMIVGHGLLTWVLESAELSLALVLPVAVVIGLPLIIAGLVIVNRTGADG